MKGIGSFETAITLYQSMQIEIAKDLRLQLHGCKAQILDILIACD
jgi:hypothetical protein